MDTQNYAKTADPNPLAGLRGRKTVVGAKQLKKALRTGQANQVFLARNADPALIEPIETLCLECKIRFAWVSTMADLGHACGIDVGAAAAAVVD